MDGSRLVSRAGREYKEDVGDVNPIHRFQCPETHGCYAVISQGPGRRP